MRKLLLTILAICAVAATASAQYSPEPGTYKVLTIDQLVLHDSARGKDIPLKIYYPQGAGPFPVVIFSHGLYGSKDSYFALAEYWASHGYVSIHPSHADSYKDFGYHRSLKNAVADPDIWQSRPKDISFIIDSLPELERRAPELRGKLDSKRLGVGGHSYGAYTTQAIGGATVQIPGRRDATSFADTRVKAIIMMSPQGEGQMGLTARSWDNMHMPMLVMYGSKDFGSQRQTPAWRSEAFFKSPPGDKYDVELEGATHMTFVGPMLKMGRENKLFQTAKIETLAFWDAYLKDDSAARKYLASDELVKFSDGAARIDRK